MNARPIRRALYGLLLTSSLLPTSQRPAAAVEYPGAHGDGTVATAVAGSTRDVGPMQAQGPTRVLGVDASVLSTGELQCYADSRAHGDRLPVASMYRLGADNRPVSLRGGKVPMVAGGASEPEIDPELDGAPRDQEPGGWPLLPARRCRRSDHPTAVELPHGRERGPPTATPPTVGRRLG